MVYPFLISIPHCGSRVPPEIRSAMALDDSEIDDARDIGSDVLFETLPAKTIIKADFSRLLVDLNRAPDNRGPKGVVAETDYRSRRIYLPGMYPDPQAIEERIRVYYQPYHEKIRQALADPGIAGLFDCHSLNGTAPADAPDAGQKRAEIVISNNGDTGGGPSSRLGEPTCSRELIRGVRSALEAEGFHVSINNPYQGGFITVHYGRQLAAVGKFAIQVEMNQDLYLDERGMDVDQAKAETVRRRIHAAFEGIAGLCSKG